MSAFLVLIIFAAWTWARCRAHLQNDFNGNGTAILNERANLTQGGGVANRWMAPITRDLAKRALPNKKRSKIRYEPHRPDIEPISVVPLEFHQAGDDFHWLAPITIGEHPQTMTFKVMIHTDAAETWAKYKRIPRKKSGSLWTKYKTSFSKPPEPPIHYTIRYPGPAHDGYKYMEQIKLGGISGELVMTAADWVEDGVTFDGVIGLQLDGVFYNDILLKHATLHPIFALHLGTTDPQIHFGGPHPLYYRGRIEYHRTSPVQRTCCRTWHIADGSIHVNRRKNVISDITTTFDTSTRFIYGPPDLVDEIYKSIQGHSDYSTKDTFPCGLKPLVKFQWNNGNKWVLNPDEFNLGPVRPGARMCRGVIKGKLHAKAWSVGTSLFKNNIYLVFNSMDPQNPEIGLARPLNPPPYPENSRTEVPPPYSPFR
ncbi:hypothetical protein APHAL10511_008276 [Amanita phalloides]|nr:hypothetical protein APHAL10511_008276 [Amanita phalloides]